MDFLCFFIFFLSFFLEEEHGFGKTIAYLWTKPFEMADRSKAAIGKRSNEIQQLETKLSAFISSMQSSLADSNAKLEAEESLRASGLEKLGNSMEALRQEVGSRVAQLEGNINEAMAGLEADLKAMVMEVKEKAQQQGQQQKDALQEWLGSNSPRFLFDK